VPRRRVFRDRLKESKESPGRWSPGGRSFHSRGPAAEKLLSRSLRPIVTDRVVWSVGLSVCLSRPWALQKTAEPIKMQSGLWTLVGPRNHALDGVQIPIRGGAFLRAKRGQLRTSSVQWFVIVASPANTAEPIDMPYRCYILHVSLLKNHLQTVIQTVCDFIFLLKPIFKLSCRPNYGLKPN